MNKIKSTLREQISTFSELTEQLTTLYESVRVIDTTLTRLSVVQGNTSVISKMKKEKVRYIGK